MPSRVLHNIAATSYSYLWPFIYHSFEVYMMRSFLQILKFFSSILLCVPLLVYAHPMSNSIMNIDVGDKKITLEAEIATDEINKAIHLFKGGDPGAIKPASESEIESHFSLMTKIENWQISSIASSDSGTKGIGLEAYQNKTITMRFSPQSEDNSRKFVIHFNAISGKIPDHITVVSLRTDFKSGINDHVAKQIGTIKSSSASMLVEPFQVELGDGSNFNGFVSIFKMGMGHIWDGTDHLMFLLVLLLPAPLLVAKGRWGQFSNVRTSIKKLIWIITSFTIGHSLTLLLGTFQLIPFSSHLIEIAIAVSVLISALHALKPLFYNKEVWIAGFFGLIHGLAFSDSLSSMPLSAWQLMLSILAFNIGIELMQIIIMLLSLPFLLAICYYCLKLYVGVRWLGATVAIISSTAWILERTTGKSNPVSMVLENAPDYTPWIIASLFILALISYGYDKKINSAKN
jgi:hypothetical protein